MHWFIPFQLPVRLRPMVGILALTAVPLSAQSANLLEVYQLAQRNDPKFEAARYTLEAAREKIPQARAGLLPVVNVTGNDNISRANTTFSNTPTVTRDVSTWAWTLQLTQPLLRVQNFYSYRESESLVEQAVAQYAEAEQDLILRVAQAYFDVLVAQESIDVAESQVQAMGEQLALAKRGFETGANAMTDVHEAQSRSDLARAQRVAALNDLENKRAELEKVIGQLPTTLAALQPAVVIPQPQPADPQAWIAQARENNPAVRAPQAALTAAEAEVKRNRAEHLPTLDFVASYGSNYASNSTIPTDYSTTAKTSQAGLQLTIPLYAGGLTSSRVTEAIANQSRLEAELELARRQAGTDARQAYAGITNGLSQVEALDSAVESSRSAVKGNQVGYKLGIKMNIDVLNAEQQLYTAQRDLAKARYDTIVQGLKLKAAAGVLSEADLVTINDLLAPQIRREN